MKKTLCLFFVLALIAQISTLPADNAADAEKDVKEQAAIGEATNDATDAAKKGIEGAAGVAKKAIEDGTDAAKQATGDATNAAAEARDRGRHGVAKHGGQDCHKPRKHHGPISTAIKGTEEFGKKIADASVDVVKDFMKIFGLNAPK